MRRKLKKFRAYIFGLSILLSFSLTYLQYDRWGEIHFLVPNPALENLENKDKENLATDLPYQPESLVLASHVNLSHPGIYPSKNSFLLYCQPFSSEHKISILRC